MSDVIENYKSVISFLKKFEKDFDGLDDESKEISGNLLEKFSDKLGLKIKGEKEKRIEGKIALQLIELRNNVEIPINKRLEILNQILTNARKENLLDIQEYCEILKFELSVQSLFTNVNDEVEREIAYLGKQITDSNKNIESLFEQMKEKVKILQYANKDYNNKLKKIESVNQNHHNQIALLQKEKEELSKKVQGLFNQNEEYQKVINNMNQVHQNEVEKLLNQMKQNEAQYNQAIQNSEKQLTQIREETQKKIQYLEYENSQLKHRFR